MAHSMEVYNKNGGFPALLYMREGQAMALQNSYKVFSQDDLAKLKANEYYSTTLSGRLEFAHPCFR